MFIYCKRLIYHIASIQDIYDFKYLHTFKGFATLAFHAGYTDSLKVFRNTRAKEQNQY